MERRESLRLGKELQVKKEHGTFVGATEDVSRGGMFLRTERSLRRGERLRLQIELPSGWTEAEVRVCWARGPQAATGAGLGVKFVQQSEEMTTYIDSSEIPEGKVPVAHEE